MSSFSFKYLKINKYIFEDEFHLVNERLKKNNYGIGTSKFSPLERW